MRASRLGFLAAAGVLTAPCAAQLTSTPHANEQTVVVTAQRPDSQRSKRDEPRMSDWHVAETNHLLVFSKGDPRELARIANNLEKLHFLLSMLLNRVDQSDKTLKLKVTLIGDAADFDHLGLYNVRWQQGPYPRAFPTQTYYDPREDGAVLATTRRGQKILLQQGFGAPTDPNASDWGWGSGTAQVMQGLAGAPEVGQASGSGKAGDASAAWMGQAPQVASAQAARVVQGARAAQPDGLAVNERSYVLPVNGRLYAAFAQHYLLTYFPLAYPRWYLEGFGEIFATMNADNAGVIEYGRAPDDYRKIIDAFGRYPVTNVLNGRYLNDKHWFPAFTPYHAWALAHLLFFSEQWKAPLHNYLAAVARGADPSDAAGQLGDMKKLQHEIDKYHGRKVEFERLSYPIDRIQPPIVRRLKESESAYVRGHLELGARVEIPSATASGTEGIAAADMTRAREKALGRREDWLNRLRKNAAEYPNELLGQLLLAEAECRSGNAGPCLAASDHALAIAPGDPVALTWKGAALTQQAIAGPASQRDATLSLAREAIAQANHADTESVLPLLAYYRSYSEAGQAAPDVAVDGLAKAMETVPSTPTTRLMLGGELAHRRDLPDARRTLLPVAHGAFDSPEKPEAQQILEAMPRK